MNFVKKTFYGFIDLLFYGNFWIALCALALFLQTELILVSEVHFTPLAGFVFSSTLFLYALHRVIGIKRVQKFTYKGRYSVIQNFKNHIIAYTFLGGILSIYFFFQLSTPLKITAVMPSLLSIGYVIPFFSNERRLRDFHFIKIFLVALVWAWVTVVLPWMYYDGEISINLILVFFERTLFIFAITIPFDIRDLKVDSHTNVSTIPSRIGIRKSLYLSYGALAFMIIISSYLFGIGYYSIGIYLGLLLSYFTTSCFIYLTPSQEHDYFYTGLIDGTMIFQFLFILIISFFIL